MLYIKNTETNGRFGKKKTIIRNVSEDTSRYSLFFMLYDQLVKKAYEECTIFNSIENTHKEIGLSPSNKDYVTIYRLV